MAVGPDVASLALEDFFKLLGALRLGREGRLLKLALLADAAPVGEQHVQVLHGVQQQLHLVEHVLAEAPVLDVHLGHRHVKVVVVPVHDHAHALAVQLAHL
eukprot:3546327-Rhodomonas_salina.1